MTDTEKKYTIRYQYGSYRGDVVVYAEDEAQAIARMWADFKRRGLLTLALASRSARVIKTEESTTTG